MHAVKRATICPPPAIGNAFVNAFGDEDWSFIRDDPALLAMIVNAFGKEDLRFILEDPAIMAYINET